MAKKIAEDNLMDKIEKVQALDALRTGFVDISVRVPVAVIITQDNCDIGERLGVSIEEELDVMYPDGDKPDRCIEENITISLCTDFD